MKGEIQMDAKTAKVVRENFVTTVAGVLDIEGAKYVGRTSEGALFRVGESDYVAVRAIVKAETFDAESALKAFEVRLEAAREREKEKESIRKEND